MTSLRSIPHDRLPVLFLFSITAHNNCLFFAFQGEAYYKSLGYKSLMDGVIGEAEKEGRGDEVRARIEAFKKKSQLKGTAVILISTAILFYYNTVNPYTPPPHL